MVTEAPSRCARRRFADRRRPSDSLITIRSYQVIARDRSTGAFRMMGDGSWRHFVEGEEWQRAGNGL
jgi:hypothetical protein